ncbi:class I SAM-dependent methyltransferase [Candidatus Omnitrophota bacterium]
MTKQKQAYKSEIRPDLWQDYWLREKRSVLARFFDKFVGLAMSLLAYPSAVSIIKKRLPCASCLEAGCGEANISSLLAASKKYNIALMDISGEAIYKAREKLARYADKIKFLQGDIYYLPFKNKAFDLSLNFGVLEHLDDVVNAVREMRRISKVVIATVPSAGPLWRFTIFLRRIVENDSRLWTEQSRLYTKEQMREFFLMADCNKVEVYRSTLLGLPFLITAVGS